MQEYRQINCKLLDGLNFSTTFLSPEETCVHQSRSRYRELSNVHSAFLPWSRLKLL